MTAAYGIPCIDLYARPGAERNKLLRRNRAGNLWIGGALFLMLACEGAIVREQMRLSVILRTKESEIRRLETQRKGCEQSRNGFARQVEKTRAIESGIAARTGWLRLLQAVSSVTTERDVMEQCTIDGRTQRALIMSGSAQDLIELQAMLQRLKALPCLSGVRLTETAADKRLGADSIHFRVTARCDATNLRTEAGQ